MHDFFCGLESREIRRTKREINNHDWPCPTIRLSGICRFIQQVPSFWSASFQALSQRFSSNSTKHMRRKIQSFPLVVYYLQFASASASNDFQLASGFFGINVFGTSIASENYDATLGHSRSDRVAFNLLSIDAFVHLFYIGVPFQRIQANVSQGTLVAQCLEKTKGFISVQGELEIILVKGG
jgi:hypothetical protein